MEHELTLKDIFACFKRNWWKILIFALLAAILIGVYTHFFVAKKYSSSVQFYIINTNEDMDFAQTNVISANTYLANDYIDIINGDDIMNAACSKLEEKGYFGFTPALIRKRLSASTSEESSIFKITVTDTNPKRAYAIASVLAEIAPDMLTDITKYDERKVTVKSYEELLMIADDVESKYPDLAADLRAKAEMLENSGHKSEFTKTYDSKPAVAVVYNPIEPTSHNSPNVVRNCFIAAVIGAVLSFAFFAMRSLINTLIRTEDDIKKAFKYPIIGTIPSWDLSEKNHYTNTNYGKKK